MENLFKESFYNIEIEQENGKTLLYNAATSALCFFDEETYKTFKGKKQIKESDINPDIIKLGFVVKKERDELSWIKYQNRMSSYNSSPTYLHFVIAPTMLCNYKCIYCFEKKYACSTIMDDETIEATLNFIKSRVEEMKPSKGINIQWFGGEPLVALKQIEKLGKKIIDYIDSIGLDYQSYIVTNGYFLTPDVTDKLVDLKITGAQITMDGMKENYDRLKKCPDDAFDKVVENIAYAQYKMGVSIRVNVNKRNVDDIKNLIKYLAVDKNIKSKIYIADIREYNDGVSEALNGNTFEDNREDLILYAKNLGIKNLVTQLPRRKFSSCEATTNKEYVIGPKGDIYRCTHLLDRKGMESGNVKTGLELTKTDLIFFDYKLPKKCDKCKIYPVCMGGCVCDRKIDKMEFNCEERIQNLKFEVKQAYLNK